MNWDARYEDEPGEYDWYISPADLCDHVNPLVSNDDEILHVGCGTSGVGEGLYRHGKRCITNIDTSKVAIKIMNQRCKELGDMQFVELDATKLPRDLTGAFQLVLDKALLDTFMCDSRRDKADRYLAEVKRVLKPGGIFCCLSHGVPDARTSIIASGLGVTSSRIKITTIPKPHVPGMDMGASPSYFLYTVRV